MATPTPLDKTTLVAWYRKRNQTYDAAGTGTENLKKYWEQAGGSDTQSAANFYHSINLLSTPSFATELEGNDTVEKDTNYSVFLWMLGTLGLTPTNFVEPFINFVHDNTLMIPANKASKTPQYKAWKQGAEVKAAQQMYSAEQAIKRNIGSARQNASAKPEVLKEDFFALFAGSDPEFLKAININEDDAKVPTDAMKVRKPLVAQILTAADLPITTEALENIKGKDNEHFDKASLMGTVQDFNSGQEVLEAQGKIAKAFLLILEDIISIKSAHSPKGNAKFTKTVLSATKSPKEIKASDITEMIEWAGVNYQMANLIVGYGMNFEQKFSSGTVKTLATGFKNKKNRRKGLDTKSAAAFEILMEFYAGEGVYKDLGSTKKGQQLLDKINEANKKQNEQLGRLAALATPSSLMQQSTQAAREEFRKNLYQCILLAAMPRLQELSVGTRTGRTNTGKKFVVGNTSKIDLSAYYNNLPVPYGGRVIPITIHPYQNSINALSLPPVNDIEAFGINQYIDSDAIVTRDLGSVVSISKVVKNFKVKKNNKEVLVNDGNEVKLPLNFAFAELVEGKDGVNLGKSLYIKSERKSIKSGPIYRDNVVLLKSINVEFKGGNMATAKSDVEVKMTFTLPDITHMDYQFEDEVKIGGEKYRYTYSFLDMITYTNNNTVTGFASIFRDQYHPDYNRLLLESYVYYAPTGTSEVEGGKLISSMLKKVPLVLDIAVVDHEIKKDARTNQAEVSISYRGYVDSAMSDPSIDALAGPKVVDERIDREERIQKKLEKGCTIDEVREQIRMDTLVSTKENIDTLKRIVESLTLNRKIYDFDIEDSTVRDSISIFEDKIARPWKILESVNKRDVNQDIQRLVMLNYLLLTNQINKPLWELSRAEASKLITTLGGYDFFANSGLVSLVDDFYLKYHLHGQDAGSLKKTDKQNLQQKEKLKDMQFTFIKFFFLGDLIDVLLDGIHTAPIVVDKAGKRTISKLDGKQIKLRTVADRMYSFSGAKDQYYFRPDPLKIITTTFDWYYPTANGKYEKHTTNLADVPISFDWFSEWYRQEIIEKKLQYYSINGFINSLAQTIITRILGDVCFNVGAEHKTLFRATTDIGLFTGEMDKLKDSRFNNITDLTQEFHDGLKDYENASNIEKGCLHFNYEKPTDLDRFPLLNKVSKDGSVGLSKIQRSAYCSYMVFYPANASSYEFQAKTNDYSAHDNGIPEFKMKNKTTSFTEDGFMHKGANSLIESMDFSKQDAPYRREVKFFASNMGNLAQISGVYNVKITLSNAAYFLFPGQLIWVDAGVNGRPNNPKSMAFVLGLGGYYQIITVKHEMNYHGGASPNCKTVIDAAWVSYGNGDEKYNFYKPSLIGATNKKPSTACDAEVPTSVPGGRFNISAIAGAALRKQQALAQGQVPAGPPTPTPKATSGKKVGGKENVQLILGGQAMSVPAVVDFLDETITDYGFAGLNFNGQKVSTKSKYKLYKVHYAINDKSFSQAVATSHPDHKVRGGTAAWEVMAFFTADGKMAYAQAIGADYLYYVDSSIIKDMAPDKP